jgi:hypothetical protein
MTAAIVTPRASTFGIAALSRALTARIDRLRTLRAERRKEVELLLAVERMAALSPHLLDDIGIGAAAGMEMLSDRA